MDFLILLKNGCDNLTATVAPSVDALGLHMVVALAIIMLVWFGVQEALASAQGDPGFSMAKFLNLFLMLTFAYCFVRFYDSSIPGIWVFTHRVHQRWNQQPCRLHRERLNAGSPRHDSHGVGESGEPLTFLN
jgi:hypothetical protein